VWSNRHTVLWSNEKLCWDNSCLDIKLDLRRSCGAIQLSKLNAILQISSRSFSLMTWVISLATQKVSCMNIDFLCQNGECPRCLTHLLVSCIPFVVYKDLKFFGSLGKNEKRTTRSTGLRGSAADLKSEVFQEEALCVLPECLLLRVCMMYLLC
jgi:hypothetical protein